MQAMRKPLHTSWQFLALKCYKNGLFLKRPRDAIEIAIIINLKSYPCITFVKVPHKTLPTEYTYFDKYMHGCNRCID